MKACRFLLFGLLFLLSGCATTYYTPFAPFDAEFESAGSGGARYIVLINNGDAELHNLKASLNIWTYRANLMTPKMSRRGYIFVGKVQLGQRIHMRNFASTIETSISERVSKVELSGHCDEGDFREVWVPTANNPLERVPTSQ
jgi:hypothetical protein